MFRHNALRVCFAGKRRVNRPLQGGQADGNIVREYAVYALIVSSRISASSLSRASRTIKPPVSNISFHSLNRAQVFHRKLFDGIQAANLR